MADQSCSIYRANLPVDWFGGKTQFEEGIPTDSFIANRFASFCLALIPEPLLADPRGPQELIREGRLQGRILLAMMCRAAPYDYQARKGESEETKPIRLWNSSNAREDWIIADELPVTDARIRT